jgi:hypothetical protein
VVFSRRLIDLSPLLESQPADTVTFNQDPGQAKQSLNMVISAALHEAVETLQKNPLSRPEGNSVYQGPIGLKVCREFSEKMTVLATFYRKKASTAKQKDASALQTLADAVERMGKAAVYAATQLNGQYRKGEPKLEDIEHSLAVSALISKSLAPDQGSWKNFRQAIRDLTIITAGILHDAVEDALPPKPTERLAHPPNDDELTAYRQQVHQEIGELFGKRVQHLVAGASNNVDETGRVIARQPNDDEERINRKHLKMSRASESLLIVDIADALQELAFSKQQYELQMRGDRQDADHFWALFGTKTRENFFKKRDNKAKAMRICLEKAKKPYNHARTLYEAYLTELEALKKLTDQPRPLLSKTVEFI